MKVLVVGATGPLGQQVVKSALSASCEVTALARRPESAGFDAAVRVIRGDVLDAASLVDACSGQDAVLCVLGSKLSRKPTTMMSAGTQNLIHAMQQTGVRRLVCVTGVGAGDSKGHGGFLYDNIIQPLLLNEIYKDKTRQEEVVRASSVEWTLVRPGQLTNGEPTGQLIAITKLDDLTIGSIARADVAAYLVGCLNDPATVRQTINLWSR